MMLRQIALVGVLAVTASAVPTAEKNLTDTITNIINSLTSTIGNTTDCNCGNGTLSKVLGANGTHPMHISIRGGMTVRPRGAHRHDASSSSSEEDCDDDDVDSGTATYTTPVMLATVTPTPMTTSGGSNNLAGTTGTTGSSSTTSSVDSTAKNDSSTKPQSVVLQTLSSQQRVGVAHITLGFLIVLSAIALL